MATDRAEATQIRRRWDQLLNNRMVFDRTRQDIADYVLPAASNIIWRRTPGARQTWFQFDSAAELAAHRLAARMNATITSPSAPWFGLKTREKDLNDIQEVAVWLEECADRMYLAYNQSNFAAEITEWYLFLATFGTAVLLMEELAGPPAQFGGFHFRHCRYGTYCVGEGPTGTVDTVYRRFELPARVIMRRWPFIKDRIPHDVKTAAENRPEAPFAIIHACEPREDRSYGKRDRLNMPWRSCYLLENQNFILDEGGFEEFPFIVARWTNGDEYGYGRGLGDQAYGDIRTLNAYREWDLRAREKAVDPATEVFRDGFEGSEIDLRPAATNYVNRPGPNIWPIESRTRFDVNDDTIGQLRASIRETFFHDALFLKESPQMTATEWNGRWQLMLQALGSTLPRVQSEGLTPCITRGFGMMLRAGALPPIPDVLRQYGANIDIQYEGPLARAQRQQDAYAVDAWVMRIGQIGTMRPEAWDMMKVDETIKVLADVGGVPPDLVQDEQVVAQIRQVRQQMLKQQRTEQTLLEAGKAAGPASRMLTAVNDAAQDREGTGEEAPTA